ncbi:MAG: molybdate ABC transporter substrate-binding protein [Succinatimonas sp.]|nr:molybdate ABC transporter substrate-binding protein [Succinatimonas sp.]
MRKTIEKLISFLVLLIPTLSWAQSLQVCAVPQTYGALEAIAKIAPIEFKTDFATATDIYAKISNQSGRCDLVIAADEKLPILLIRSNKAKSHLKQPLVRAPLLLWSAKTDLLDKTAQAVSQKRLKSIALADPRLTPVGFATHQIVSQDNFPTAYLKGHIYRADHEYQVYAMVAEGNVECGFLTKPLVVKNGKALGSYWQVPRNNYPDLIYYALPLNESKYQRDIQTLVKFLTEDPRSMNIFINAGFSKL